MPSPRPDRATGAALLEPEVARVVARVGRRWEALHRRAVFVTGGTGFVGRWMVASLLQANDALHLDCRVLILSRDTQAFSAAAPEIAGHPAVELLRGGPGTFEFPRGRFTHILHLAKEPLVGDATPAGDADPGPLAAGTRRVLAFAEACGAERLLFTSSGAVYGRQPPDVERLREDHPARLLPGDPHAVYAAQKRAAEALCLAAQGTGSLGVTIARCFALLGPFMDFDGGYAAGNFVRDAVSRDAVVVTGDGKTVRSYLYAEDLAVWLWTILFDGRPGTPYNVGSPHAVAIADLARLVAATAGAGCPVRIAGARRHDGLPDRYVPDTTLAQTTLGLSAEIGLETAIRRTAAWYRGQRSA